MKRMKILLLLVTAMCIMLLAGCGEQEKYNTTKNEVLTLMQQAESIEVPDLQPLTMEQANQAYEDAVKKHESVDKQIQDKLKLMEEYAGKETTLNNDLIVLKRNIQEKNDTWNRITKQQIYIKKMADESAKSTLAPDPWQALVKKRAEQQK